MFNVGDLVKVDKKAWLGIEGFDGLLVVNEVDEPWYGLERFEVKNSDGDLASILANALVLV
jgi:hypothetical protein